MPVIGFHASHEQIHPAILLDAVRVRREGRLHRGDVLRTTSSPWSARQGHSGFAWSWLGAALQATDLPFGVVNAPRPALSPGDHRPGGGQP